MNASEPRGTPSADKLNGDAVQARCISDGTVARYRSYINGIPKWVMANKNIFNSQRFFDASGDLDPRRFTPKDFESFLVDKRETLKAGTQRNEGPVSPPQSAPTARVRRGNDDPFLWPEALGG
ncbi:hypothetical protein C6341_g24936 [Phytophthora cactorum]|nr:hypothetical protein C6341_g24936 [Phytophthora cactorum]